MTYQEFPRNMTDFSILLVDDCKTATIAIAALLKSVGFSDIEIANSGESALDILNSNQTMPDIIMCDLVMPGINGFEVLDHVRAHHPHCIFMIMTATNTAQCFEYARKHHVDGYLLKPFKREDIIVELKLAISRVHIAVDNFQHLGVEHSICT